MGTDAQYPLITLDECDSFERHAEHGAQHDPSGEGVYYSLIQPYDLVRFCNSVRRLHASAAAWREYAEHAGGCVICGETSWEDCWDGKQLRKTALALDAETNNG